MGMGNYACHADTVTDEFVKETCPEELDKLRTVLDETGYDFDRLGYNARSGDIEGEMSMELEDDQVMEIMKTYAELCKAFQDKIGLELDLGFHECEDRGDEVDGWFWVVEGVYVLSEAGEKHKNKIARKFWTEFG